VAALCRVRAGNYSGLSLKLYADGKLFASLAPGSATEFVVPAQAASALQLQIATGSGNCDVQTVQLVEQVEELT
jgi:hypothetical protein